MVDSYQECGIYAIVNTHTGQTYIGLTSKPFRRRWAIHRSELRNGAHWNKQLQNDWDNYGPDVFDFRVIEILHHRIWARAMRERELFYIRNTPFVYNCAPGDILTYTPTKTE
jgi:group I intron endonuclease